MNRILFITLGIFLLACTEIEKPILPNIGVIHQASRSKASFRGIAVKNDKEVWVCGTNGTVLRTTNSGEQWNKMSIPGADSLDFRDIELLGENSILLMSAGSGSASRIYKSDDQGAIWRLVYTNPHEKGFYNGFDFWDEKSGILIGDAIDKKLFLMKTTDGGENWGRVGEKTLPDLIEGEYGFAASGTGITTFRDQKVWIATGGMAARVFYSSDAAVSWKVANTPMLSGKSSTGSFSIAFKDEQHGVAVGGDYAADSIATGNVILTNDGGQSWSGIENPLTIPFKSCVAFLGNNNYLAIGTSGVSLSIDDGKNWSTIDNSSFHTMDFDHKSAYGWMAGGDGKIAKFSINKSDYLLKY